MKRLFPILFLTLFLGILTVANIYLSSRFNYYFNFENSNPFNFLFPALTVFMIFGMIPLSNSTKRLSHIIYILSAMIMGVLLNLLLSALVVDLANLFIHFSPRISGILALAITFLVSVSGIVNAWIIRITQYKIEINNLKKEVRIMHLSDIHIGHFRGKRFLQKIVDKTNQQNVDTVFITGDLFDGRIRLTKDSLLPLSDIKVPVFFIEGNHDKYTGVQTIKNLLKEMNIRVLENEVETLGELQIIGLNHMAADDETFNIHTSGVKKTIKSTLSNLSPDKNKPTVLLHHSPDGIKYASENGVDLYLSGHTHGGQLFPVNYIAKLIFEYRKGWHEYKGTKLFVSQGVGTFGPPMRIGTKSEISVIRLKPLK